MCYLGPATEWVPNSEVDWNFLNNPKSVISNDKLIKNYPDPIRRIPTNDLLVMKGKYFSSSIIIIYLFII